MSINHIIDDVIWKGQLLQDACGNLTVETIDYHLKIIPSFIIPDELFNLEEYDYYHRNIMPRWKLALDTVKLNSRRNVFCDASECISMIHILSRKDSETMIVNMRSCDVIKKLPTNIIILKEFSQWANIIINISSAHVYIKDLLKYYTTGCCRRQSVSLILQDNKLAAIGKNGCYDAVNCIKAARGIKSGESLELCRGIHSEVDAILKALQKGYNLSECSMISWWSPCAPCARVIINSGIKSLMYVEQGSDESAKLAMDMLANNNIEVKKLDDKIQLL